MAFSFIGWINKPYLDLSPAISKAPLHTNGVEFEFLNLCENAQLPRINSILMPSFRESLISQSGLLQFAIDDPLNVREQAKSEQWKILCECVNNFYRNTPYKQSQIIRLLNKLCFYNLVISLQKQAQEINWRTDSEIAYQYALAHKMIALEQTGDSSMKNFLEIIERSPNGSEAKINSLYQMAIYYIKNKYNKLEASKWIALHLKEICKAKNFLDEFTYTQFLSRYHRVNGFIPQMDNNQAEVVSEMTKAEFYAKKLFDLANEKNLKSHFYLIAAQEMLYPVFESRTKEALWLKDLPLAELRAQKFVEMCPNDSRARLNLGQILLEQYKIEEALVNYKAACLLGPPGTEVSWFMLGQCYEATENFNEAINAYIISLQIDPHGISSRESLLNLLDKYKISMPEYNVIKEWVLELSLEYESTNNKSNFNRDVKQYQISQFEETAK